MTMNKVYLFLFVSFLVIGCISQDANINQTKTTAQEKNVVSENKIQQTQSSNNNIDQQPPQNKKFFTMEEISKHNNKNDCYLLIEGKVYDVTEFIAKGQHPPAIELGCGKDATTLFRKRQTEDGQIIGSGKPHSPQAEQILQNYYIGDLSK